MARQSSSSKNLWAKGMKSPSATLTSSCPTSNGKKPCGTMGSPAPVRCAWKRGTPSRPDLLLRTLVATRALRLTVTKGVTKRMIELQSLPWGTWVGNIPSTCNDDCARHFQTKPSPCFGWCVCRAFGSTSALEFANALELLELSVSLNTLCLNPRFVR